MQSASKESQNRRLSFQVAEMADNIWTNHSTILTRGSFSVIIVFNNRLFEACRKRCAGLYLAFTICTARLVYATYCVRISSYECSWGMRLTWISYLYNSVVYATYCVFLSLYTCSWGRRLTEMYYLHNCFLYIALYTYLRQTFNSNVLSPQLFCFQHQWTCASQTEASRGLWMHGSNSFIMGDSGTNIFIGTAPFTSLL